MMQQSEEFSLPKKWGTLRPKFIISLVAILAFIGVVIGFFEISQSQRGIMQLLREEAQTVTEALMISAENAVQSYGEVEALVESQLLHSAQVLMQLQNDKVLSKKRFEKIMLESGVAKAFYVNSKGYLSGFEFPADAVEHFDRQKVVQFITPLFSKKLERLSGFVEDTAGKSHYAVALMRTPETFWVLCADQNVLLEFRRRVGIGRLIQDIGQNEEIAYIVLQDEEGIISATKNISSIVRLSRDPFLVQALSKNELISRVTQFEGQDVFEVVKPFAVQGNVFGLIRVGIKMDAAHQAVTRTVQRAAAVALGFIIIGVILFNFLVTHQNYALLTDAYAKIKTYTGNILQNMADAVVAVNQDGRITLFNRAAEKLFRKSAEKAVGRSCRDIIDNQTSLLDQTLLTGKGLRDEEVDYQINGHKTILNITTTLLKNADGQIDSAVAVLKDLTEKKAWEERLQRQEKLTAMGELASGVAHEIRNPLNAISIIAQRLSWEFAPKDNADEYRELAQSMVSETRRVSQIIARFLEFARPPKLILQKHDIRAIIKKAVTLVETQAKEQGVAIKIEGDAKSELLMDGNQMQQVFLNLLQNSLHATPLGGEISVRFFTREREAELEITDTGQGIPSEHLPKIFDLYFTTKENGTGMGLSISHRIVSEHGGRIEVKSQAKEGSTFRIFLPLTEPVTS